MRIELRTPLSSDDLLKYAVAFSLIKTNHIFTHITTDSRETKEGDLFFSLSKSKESAEIHIAEAHKIGAFSVSSLSKTASYLVKDAQTALLKLALLHKSRLKNLKKTVAITGSVGKTTTKEFTYAFLNTKFKAHKTYMNYNNALGLAISLLLAPIDTEILVLELGMNAPLEIKALSDAVKPDLAVITNIGNAHVGKLGSREMIAKSKLEISAGMTEDFIIAPYEEALLKSAKCKFSLTKTEADYFLSKAESENALEFYKRGRKISEFTTKYKAPHHLKALLIALIIANILGFNEEQMLSGVKATESLALRQKIINLRRFSLLDDTYSSSPEAVLAEIEFLKLEYPERRFSVALGDMLELGHKTEALHKEIGALAYKKGARRLYTFGAYAYLIRDGAREAGMKDEDISSSTEIDNYPIIAKEIYEKSIDSEIVLVKASHSLSSEKIIKEIERLDSEC